MSILTAFADSANFLTRRSWIGSIIARTAACGASEGLARVPGGHSAPFDIAGWPFLVTVWTDREWERLAEDRRPGDAIRLDGLGWIWLRHHDEAVNT